jgi:hypothetical protein
MILWLAIVMLLQVLKRYIQSAGQLCQDFFRSGAKPNSALRTAEQS